jgi:aspartyl-tRNA(Asn)/glutamyl-tRNA(Gln) amidotransferase subunit C
MPVEIDIDHVARLARLDLSADEKKRLRVQLGLILEHAARGQEVAADEVPPTSYAVPRANVFRGDEAEPCLSHEDAMAGAPEVESDRFKVPRVVEVEDEAR